MPILELFLFAATPIVAAQLVRLRGLSWLDPVLTCYAVGLLLANTPYEVNDELTKTVTEAVVPLAIPLLLFQTDFVRWLRSSRKVLLAFAIAVFSVLVSIAVATAIFAGSHDQVWAAAGMYTGTWTGGSPNLISVGTALGVTNETLIQTNAADVFIGGIYLFALLTFARPMLAFVMREPDDWEPMEEDEDDAGPLSGRIGRGAQATLLAVAVVGVSVGLSLLAFDGLPVAWVILGITTGGIGLSFVERVRKLDESYAVGNYLILVFCVAIGALTDLSQLAEAGSFFLQYGATALAMTLALHYTLCALLRIDVDTAIITSTATVMGPPLVVPVAKRLDNRIALVSGITCGLVGYALGNYLGILVGELLR